MSKLIIVCGLPGSGKTTLAKELSKKMKITCIHKDSIKECLFDSFEFSTLDDSKKLGKPSILTLFRLAEEQIVNDINIIIEAPFNFSDDYQLFNQWKKKYNLEIISIICSVDREERKKRFRERERHHSHHDVDRKLYSSIDEVEYDYATIPGKQIRIKTELNVNDLVGNIISQIN